MNIPDEAVQAAKREIKNSTGDWDHDIYRALTAAAPYMSGVKVKALGENDYEVIIDAASKAMRKATSGVRGQAMMVHDCLDWWVMKATENHILSALEPSSAREQALEEAATLIDEGFDKAVGKSWRNDGKPSKNDMCPHDKFMYEDCERCASAAIRALKSQPARIGGGDE